jgi:hypothetical protein
MSTNTQLLDLIIWLFTIRILENVNTTGKEQEWKPYNSATDGGRVNQTGSNFLLFHPLVRPLFTAKIMTPKSDDRTQTSFRHRKTYTRIETNSRSAVLNFLYCRNINVHLKTNCIVSIFRFFLSLLNLYYSDELRSIDEIEFLKKFHDKKISNFLFFKQ